MMTSREKQKLDAAEIVRITAAASAGFQATLSAGERSVLETLHAHDGHPGLVYSTGERGQALEDFELLGAAESLEILAEQIRVTVKQREQELYRQCLKAYYIAEELARDPANAQMVPHVEAMRRAHLAQYGRPIPPKAA